MQNQSPQGQENIVIKFYTVLIMTWDQVWTRIIIFLQPVFIVIQAARWLNFILSLNLCFNLQECENITAYLLINDITVLWGNIYQGFVIFICCQSDL